MPTNDLVSNEANIVGNLVGSYNDLQDLMALTALGAVTLHTQKYPLENFQQAISDHDAGKVRGRAILVPPSMVDNRQANGKTANEELLEQLQLLAPQAETLHASRHRQTSMDLINTGNFLRERFGHQPGGFDFGIK